MGVMGLTKKPSRLWAVLGLLEPVEVISVDLKVCTINSVEVLVRAASSFSMIETWSGVIWLGVCSSARTNSFLPLLSRRIPSIPVAGYSANSEVRTLFTVFWSVRCCTILINVIPKNVATIRKQAAANPNRRKMSICFMAPNSRPIPDMENRTDATINIERK